MKKKFTGFMLVVILLLTLSTAVFAVPEPSRLFYAADYADVLTAEHEQYYINQGHALEQATGAQIVVATVTSLEGEEIASYALTILRDWEIGSEQEDNGLLILLAPEERQIYIAVGYGLEGAINDAKAGRMLDDYAIPYLSDNQFDEGVYQVYNALLAEVYQEYQQDVPESVESAVPESSSKNEIGSIFPAAIIVLIVFGILFSGPKGRGGGGRRPPGSFGGGFPGGFGGHFHGGGGFGGFSGGGGFGGGGGFSGGGGSGGGGGAGRSF